MSVKPLVKMLQSSDGTPIYAEFVGDSGKPCLVLIHGFSLSCLVWDNIFREAVLLDEVCMVRYDLRGHGRSGRPEGPEAYKSSLFADDFASVMREFGIHKSMLVGWSYGGSIACDIAAHIGMEVLIGIIYVAAVPYLGRPMFPDSATRYTTVSIQAQQDPLDVASFIQAKTNFFRGIWVDSDALDDRFCSSLLAPSYTQTPQVIKNILRRLQDPTPLLEACREGKRVLMLYGDGDKLLNCDYTRKLMVPHCAALDVYVVKGGGHAPFYEHREEFVREVLRFVKLTMKISRL
ncbi:Alpha/Beta hydrolase protein [Fomitopsis betulina]|nr:Alpha/Beta hydrolase protein [Fomitopsis betulina]